jgi:hypothetical protein
VEYVLGIALVSAVGGLIWSAATAVRLALARRDDATEMGKVTAQRDAALANLATAAESVVQHKKLAESGQRSAAAKVQKEIHAVATKTLADDAILAARARYRERLGLPPLPPSGVPDVPSSPTAAADQAPAPSGLRDGGGAGEPQP